ncbi:unnamed protein product, partial [Prorocentrum cordatum]
RPDHSRQRRWGAGRLGQLPSTSGPRAHTAPARKTPPPPPPGQTVGGPGQGAEEGRRGPLAGTARGAPCPAAARGGRAGASGVRPSSSCALRSALAFASSCVVTSTPSFTAPCSGVSPCLFRASIGAPRCSSRPAIST